MKKNKYKRKLRKIEENGNEYNGRIDFGCQRSEEEEEEEEEEEDTEGR